MEKPYPIVDARVRKSPFMKVHTDVDEAKRHVRRLLLKKGGEIGFTYKSSLKSMGLLKRADGKYKLGEKYKRILPALRPASTGGKKHTYKLDDPFAKRKLALDEGIASGARRYGSLAVAARKKKARLNMLRIYRRYSNPKHCAVITHDMRYIDDKYLSKSKTSNICASKR